MKRQGKVIVFGVGRMYQNFKDELRDDIEIIVFIDNDVSKWDSLKDGIPIVCPRRIIDYTYDFIFLMSSYQKEMREQLAEIGVPGEKIVGLDQIERICKSRPTEYFGMFSEISGVEKILVYSHALTSTGAQNMLYFAIQILHRVGYRLTVVSKTDGILKERILALGVPVIIMENPHVDNQDFIKLINWADKVIVNTVWLYYAAEELLYSGKRVIWWIHETTGYEYLSENLVRNIRESDSLSVYAVSPLVKRRMVRKFGTNIRIRELAYGLPVYAGVRKGVLQREKKVFAIIGGIGHHKGQDIFIKAVEELSADYRDKAEFWIIGSGKLEKEDVERAGLYSCIKITGEIENQKMPDLYSEIDVVVCCSREESMAVVVTEGCMNEKLVIVSDAAGNADYIADGKNGLLFRCGDSRQLAQKMQWVIDHETEAREIGHTGKAIYENYFKMELFEDRFLNAIEG